MFAEVMSRNIMVVLDKEDSELLNMTNDDGTLIAYEFDIIYKLQALGYTEASWTKDGSDICFNSKNTEALTRTCAKVKSVMNDMKMFVMNGNKLEGSDS